MARSQAHDAVGGDEGHERKADGVRSRVRTELTNEILTVAKHHLATQGPTGVALRAIARDVGMVSSAIYRYFPSRDDLLTALIVDAYEDLADAIESGERKPRRSDLRARWFGAGRALRQWAIDHPHEFSLIYGTPIPGYQAPEATIAPVLRASDVMVGILRDGLSTGAIDAKCVTLTAASSRALAPMRGTYPDMPAELLARGFSAWINLIGLVSFELFGHMNNVVENTGVFFEHELSRLAGDMLGQPS